MRYVVALCVIVFSLSLYAQHDGHSIKGKVTGIEEGKTINVVGAFIHWVDNKTGVYTDSLGEFTLKHQGESPYLIASSVSFASDTQKISDMRSFITFQLEEENTLKGATVIGRKISYGLSKLSPRTTVLLSEREFQKAACCNLSESFENAPAIDVSFADAVSGTKQIKMLGLDGFYTMIGREYMPAVRTLNSYYGMSHIPSAWVSGIQITKGAGSVVNGYESMAGQINIELKKPFGKNHFLLDQFVSEGGRSETDLMYRKDINKHLATSLFARGAFRSQENDRNNDGFLDNPTGNHFQVMNRWQMATDKGLEGQLGVGFNTDNKNAGQTAFHNGDGSAYGIELSTQQADIFAKLGKSFKDKPYKSFGSQYAFNRTTFEGRYGTSASPQVYEATSSMLYINLLYQSIIGNSFHTFQTGLSLLSDETSETYELYHFSRIETVPGAFFEYTYKPKETFSLVGGIRSDYNTIYGLSITPRLHGKYRFNKGKTAVRFSTGTGRRTSNPISQNQQLLASGRSLNFEFSDSSLPFGLEQEVALNSGISFEHEFRLTYMPATIGLDFFNTTFMQEVVLDRETAGEARFYNMKNGKRANSFQAQLDLQPGRRTDIRVAYRLFDVQTKYKDFGRIATPFISRDRAFVNVTQSTRSQWQFTSTATWYGPQRVAGDRDTTIGFTGIVITDRYSPNFILLNAQVSKTFKKQFELYIGAENILNYKQENPIQASDQPFSSEFDAGLVWGPVFGRMIYGGFRWRITGK